MEPRHIKVRVKTGSRTEELVVRGKDSLAVSIREKPERNEANRRLLALLARHFSVPQGNIRIIKGHKTPSKIFLVRSK